jgi:hypothetical protein
MDIKTEDVVNVKHLISENLRLHKEVAYWKANHDCIKTRLQFASQRLDLPVDRIPVYEQMQQRILELESENERLSGTVINCINRIKAYPTTVSVHVTSRDAEIVTKTKENFIRIIKEHFKLEGFKLECIDKNEDTSEIMSNV